MKNTNSIDHYDIFKCDKGIPFNKSFSLIPLLEYWEETIADNVQLKSAFETYIKNELKKYPYLQEPVRDMSVLEKHRKFIDTLMSVIFPPASCKNEIGLAVLPFSMDVVYATAGYRWFEKAIADSKKKMFYDQGNMILSVIYFRAYKVILKEFYDIDYNFDYPLVIPILDPETGLERHFKFTIDKRFVKIKNLKKIKPLTSNQKKMLMENTANLDIWRKIIPPENFEFQGFIINRAFDISDQETVRLLKDDLTIGSLMESKERFESVERRLQSLMNIPGIKMGLVGLEGGKRILVDCGFQTNKSLIFTNNDLHSSPQLNESIYGEVISDHNPHVLSDLTNLTKPTEIEKQIIDNGFKSFAVLPLIHQNKLLAVLELGVDKAGALFAINILKLNNILPLFSLSLIQSMEALNNRIQKVINENCTAIHQAVEWRFRQAALNYVRDELREGSAEMEEVVFDNVYSIYGLSDIRGSSTQRNFVIQSDLIDHLDHARDILFEAKKQAQLPVLDELIFRTQNYEIQIAKSLTSEDEAKVIEFLHYEIEPIFNHLAGLHPRIQKKVEEYHKMINPELGILYRKRKEFDESVAQITDMISTYLDEQEEVAQKMFPHYFEKFKTDGVDYNIYLGASLSNDKTFDTLYLKNMRLWQLMLMIGIVQKADRQKSELKMPLDTAHLILVQSQPISIQFRFDEKRFDVNGAYNVKYEIMKKRIDKALIKGTDERLTQPGKIAIVYSQGREIQEYYRYIEYLISKGLILGEVQDLELSELQGVQGLRALRINVNCDATAQENQPSDMMDDIAKVLASD